MKESLRRIILFAVIVITGSVMILFDVPLIIMVPLILLVGFVVLFLLGAITRAEIRAFFKREKSKKVKKISLIQRLNEMKFFEKKSAQPVTQQPSPKKKEDIPKSAALIAAKKPGAGSLLQSFFTSLGSLRTVLKERSKQAKKVEHIDKLLDKTVSEKVKSSALAKAGSGVDTKIPPPEGGGGFGLKEKEKDQDPFLSLSGDEFDISLLDGLDEQETTTMPSSGQIPATGIAQTGPALAINESEIPMPSLDIISEAEDILKGNQEGLEEFVGLEGADSIDQSFGDLSDVNLDDIDLDVDLEGEPLPDTGSPPPSAAASSPPMAEPGSPLQAESTATNVKTDWVASDAPKDAGLPGNGNATRNDMASFAGGASSSDADMLSSLASDVKYVPKEQNLSLLRDLKDFKAPATEIEKELKDVHDRIKAGNTKKKTILPSEETK